MQIKQALLTDCKILFQHFFEYLSYLFSSQIPLDYCAVGSEQYDLWNARNAVSIGWNLLGIDNVIPRHIVLFYKLLGSLSLIPHRNTENSYFVSIVFVNLSEVRDFSFARSAPRCPKIYKHIPAFSPQNRTNLRPLPKVSRP